MTNEEAIKILQGMNLDLMYPNGEYAVDGLPEDKLKKYLATGKAITALRRAQPANEPLVTCGECVKYQTPNCAAKHEQALMDFCSHGIRKPGGEQT